MISVMQNHYIPQTLMTLSVIKLTFWLWKMLIQHASSLRVIAKYNNTPIYDKNQTAAGRLTKIGNTLLCMGPESELTNFLTILLYGISQLS